MGSSKEMKFSYLVQDLSGDEDPGLQSNRTYMDAPSRQYKVPPGIRNLQQWGETMIPSGIQQGQTFSEVYDNHPCYIFQIRNRKAVSPWLRNLQNYVIARQKYEALNQTPILPTSAGSGQPSKSPTTSRPSAPHVKTEAEWEMITKAGSTSSNTKKSQAPKRTTSETEKSGKAKMTVEPNAERVWQIQTQIALLQRELARETQIPEEEDI